MVAAAAIHDNQFRLTSLGDKGQWQTGMVQVGLSLNRDRRLFLQIESPNPSLDIGRKYVD